ncbi:MAG: trigger factor [Treponema sp.]|nr:trigger factor [Treponema sp.]
MAITKEIKRLEKSNVALSITVPKEDVRAQYNKMLNDYTKSLQIPGFRKGKVPKEVLERKFSEALKGDALGRIVESTLKDIFDNTKDDKLSRNERPLPYSTPQLQEEDLTLDLEQDLCFSVVYDVLPEIKIGQWKGLNVEYPYAEAGEEDIGRELEEIRERNAVVMDRDDGAAARKGDVVTIDYQVLDPIEEGAQMPLSRKDLAFTLDGKNVFKFDDSIIGMKKGQTKDIDHKFSDDFYDASHAGVTRKMQITLTAVKEKKLPQLDDDLAQDVDEKFNTLDDLKNNIREKLTKNLETRLREKKLSVLLGKIMENTPVTLPEAMIKTEVEGRIRRIARYYNTNEDIIMQMTGEDKMNEMREASQKALHSRLIIETLMEEHNIDVTDDEVEKEIENVASINNTDIAEVRKYYDSEQAMIYLREDIKEKKIIDLMLAENNLKPGKKENYLVYMTDNG